VITFSSITQAMGKLKITRRHKIQILVGSDDGLVCITRRNLVIAIKLRKNSEQLD